MITQNTVKYQDVMQIHSYLHQAITDAARKCSVTCHTWPAKLPAVKHKYTFRLKGKPVFVVFVNDSWVEAWTIEADNKEHRGGLTDKTEMFLSELRDTQSPAVLYRFLKFLESILTSLQKKHDKLVVKKTKLINRHAGHLALLESMAALYGNK